MDENGIRTKVRGKPGKFSASEANKTGNIKKLLAKYKSLQWDKVLRLEEVQAKLGVSLEEMLLITEDALHPEPYSPEEVCRCLGISLKELRTQILSPNTQDGSETECWEHRDKLNMVPSSRS
uniref:Galactokinase 2 n=1 Tax=Rousettus aegyptiacus TaxID=9407 RepID=A0A7J8IK50_ROUAE|nr:galactokinase 2 [Rousettus aegyptiacus]